MGCRLRMRRRARGSAEPAAGSPRGRHRAARARGRDPGSHLGEMCAEAAVLDGRSEARAPSELPFCWAACGREVPFPTVADGHFLAMPPTCDDSTSRPIAAVHNSRNCEPGVSAEDWKPHYRHAPAMWARSSRPQSSTRLRGHREDRTRRPGGAVRASRVVRTGRWRRRKEPSPGAFAHRRVSTRKTVAPWSKWLPLTPSFPTVHPHSIHEGATVFHEAHSKVVPKTRRSGWVQSGTISAACGKGTQERAGQGTCFLGRTPHRGNSTPFRAHDARLPLPAGRRAQP